MCYRYYTAFDWVVKGDLPAGVMRHVREKADMGVNGGSNGNRGSASTSSSSSSPSRGRGRGGNVSEEEEEAEENSSVVAGLLWFMLKPLMSFFLSFIGFFLWSDVKRNRRSYL
mgnify:CR=1 FL=1